MIERVMGYNDPGFTEGCLEIPNLQYTFPDYDVIVRRAIRAPKGMEFSSFRVAEPYTNWEKVTYLRMSIVIDEVSRIYCGWVDKVSLIADDPDNPLVQVDWHIDPWMTWGGQATFGYGMLQRKPWSTGVQHPPQDYPYRYLYVSHKVELISGDMMWVLVQHIRQYSNNEKTAICVSAFPVGNRESYTLYLSDSNTTYQSIGMGTVSAGNLEERLGISPSQILTVSLSPLAPFPYVGTGTEDDPIRHKPLESVDDPDIEFATWTVETLSSNQAVFTTWQPSLLTSIPSPPRFKEFKTFINRGYSTTDFQRVHVTNLNGETIGVIPWGLEARTYTMRLLMTGTRTYIQLRFGDVEGMTEGLTFDIPLPLFDITQNSWSDYVYSGQQTYTAGSLRESNLHQYNMGTISAVTMGVGGGFAGGQQAGVPGAVVGASAGVIGGMVSASLGYAENQRYTDTMLGLTASAKASQLESITVYGDSPWDEWRHGEQGIHLYIMRMDGYSEAVAENERDINGVKVCEPIEDCTSLIAEGGPLQIDNLIVGGPIPDYAKQYIRTRLRAGVRII